VSEDVATRFRELLQQGYKLEEKGREVASRLDDEFSTRDLAVIQRMAETIRELRNTITELENRFDFVPQIASAVGAPQLHWYLYDAETELKRLVPELRLIIGARKREKLSEVTPYWKEIVEHVENFANAVSKLVGRKTTWLLDRVPPSEYTIAALLNDVTSTFHALLDFLSTTIGSKLGALKLVDEIEGIEIYATPDADPELLNLVRDWARACAFYRRFNMYDDADYRELKAIVMDKKAMLRVGSAAGHATHVSKEYDRYVAEYYDEDWAVNEALKQLAANYGIVGEDLEEEPGVRFYIPKPRAQHFFMGVLPFATSMDIRLRGTVYDIAKTKYREDIEALAEEAGTDFEDALKAFVEENEYDLYEEAIPLELKRDERLYEKLRNILEKHREEQLLAQVSS